MLPDYQDLLLLEPRLAEVEAAARAVVDEGELSFFCSNYAWLPINARLKAILGTGRKEPPPEGCDQRYEFGEEDLAEGSEGGEEDDIDASLLHDSRMYELAYLELSALIPPCRNCGCQRFMPLLLSQIEAAKELHGPDPEGPARPDGAR